MNARNKQSIWWIRTGLALLIALALSLGAGARLPQGVAPANTMAQESLVRTAVAPSEQRLELRRGELPAVPAGGGTDSDPLLVPALQRPPANRLRQTAVPRAPPALASRAARAHPVRAPPFA
ncbi:hypothetical protein KUV73_15775 [Mameliella alba]|nr:hypothetical protein [Mameliella alba]MBY6170820.1 hypothetical protein [Mameliella alba]MBY6175833.1 hypothetical protein [Mameliella alba]